MNCDEARLLIGADPTAADPRVEAHLSTCQACRAWRDEMLALDARIRRAVLMDVPARAVTVTTASPCRRVRPARGWLAVAASVLIVLTSAVAVWLVQAPSALARDVIDHMAMEPHAWSTDSAVTRSTLELVLARGGVRLSPQAGPVTYAHSCWFRGQWVPHLVVQTTDGPMTVLILAGERGSDSERFDEGRYTGIILPTDGGSIAVLSLGRANVEAQARALFTAVTWPGTGIRANN